MKNFRVSGFAAVATIILVMIYLLGTILFSRKKISEEQQINFESYHFTMMTTAAASTVYQNVTLPNGTTELEPVCMVSESSGFSIERIDASHARCKSPRSEVALQPFELKH